MKAVEDHDSGVSNHVSEEDIGLKDEELELEPGRAQKTENPTEAFVTSVKGQPIIAEEVKN